MALTHPVDIELALEAAPKLAVALNDLVDLCLAENWPAKPEHVRVLMAGISALKVVGVQALLDEGHANREQQRADAALRDLTVTSKPQ